MSAYKVNYLYLGRQRKNLGINFLKDLNIFFKKNSYILGKNVESLEKKLSKFVKSKYCIATSSGSDALVLSLMSLSLKKNSEVITTPFSFVSTAEAIKRCQLKPIFVDLEKDSINLDLNKLKKKINKNTSAIICVSLFGNIGNIDQVKILAKKKKISLIEDAAQSFGSKYAGFLSCNIADIGCTSFYPSKALGCYGDGGAIFTNNKKIANKCKVLRNHGQKKKYNSIFLGLCARLDELQAFILLKKIKIFNKETFQRRKIYNLYTKNFNKIEQIRFLNEKSGLKLNFSYFPILTKKRNKLFKYLRKNQIACQIFYPKLLSNMKPYKTSSEENFPNAEILTRQIIQLPISAYHKASEIKYTIKHIKLFFKNEKN
ncbi:aminotransferase class I/II-fold pyridoxal phosphate-dependent enzyme [Pelagibacteraceae bacterium]|nr:aminotransferase class I/II-fold pyridoxal phosphate-dependent enzyme [Pelagibacteraceae bacterium]